MPTSPELLASSQEDLEPEHAKVVREGDPSQAGPRRAAAVQIERRSGKRRRIARHYRFHDRRTGFDRRRHNRVLEVLRDSSWALVSLLVLLNLLSMLDGLLTAAELSTGLAQEGNPLFRGLIGAHPLLAGGMKVVIMIAVSVLLWHWRRYRAMLVLALGTLGLYAMLLGYHFGSLAGLLRR